MWSVLQCWSHFLPLCPLFPLPLVSPSFTVCLSLSVLFHFTICPFCDLGVCGRQGDGLQAAVEISSRPTHGRADQLISPRSQKHCRKSGREWSLQLLLQIFVLCKGPWHTKSKTNSKTNKGCLIKHFASCLLSSLCSNAHTEQRADPSWEPSHCQHVCMLQTCVSGNISLVCISIPKNITERQNN